MNTQTFEKWLSPKGLLWASVAVACITIALKTLAWHLTDSVGLLSDAMESLVNLASAVFGLMMVTVAAKPADEDHAFGHTSAEDLAAFAITGAAGGHDELATDNGAEGRH